MSNPIKTFHRSAILIGIMIAASAAAQQRSASDPEVQLRTAEQKILRDGDIEGAIEIYKRVAETRGVSRATAAKAWLAMGQAYEKVGHADARKAYERVIKDYADQEFAAQAEAHLKNLGLPASQASQVVTPRGMQRLFAGSSHVWTAVTPDGRYLQKALLPILDLATGQYEAPFPEKDGGPDYSKVLSPDQKWVAYGFETHSEVPFFGDWNTVFDVRLRPFHAEKGAQSKVLLHSEEFVYSEPFAWSPDGRDIYAILTRTDLTHQIVAISAATGSLRTLKSLEWRWPGKLSLSPDGRYIAYDAPVSRNSGNRDILVISTDGSGETTIVEDPARDALPVWTPDGKAVVFTSDRFGSLGLWAIEVVQGRPRGTAAQLKKDVRPLFPLGFTRDGSFYYRTDEPAHTDAYTAEIDLASGIVSNPKALERVPGRSSNPAYSPDGKSLAYFSRRGSFLSSTSAPIGYLTLVIRSIGTGEEREIPRTLTDNVLFPMVGGELTWSSDGRSLIFIGRNQDAWALPPPNSLHRIDIDTREDLIDRNPDLPWRIAKVAASPDGKRLYYWRGSTLIADDLYKSQSALIAYDVETSREVELLKKGQSELFQRLGAVNYGADLVVSPDGQQIAFLAGGSINVIPALGGAARQLKTPRQATQRILQWSSDGEKVLVETAPARFHRLWWVRVDGGEAEAVGTATHEHSIRSISPDGKHIAYTVERPRDPNEREIWVDADLLPSRDGSGVFLADLTSDGTARRVVSLMQSLTFRYLAPSWSPDGKSIVVKRRRQQDGEVAYDSVVRSLDTGEERIHAGALGQPVGADTGQPSLWFHNGESLLDFGGSACQGGCFLRTPVKDRQGPTLAAQFGFSVVNKLAVLSPDDRLLYVVPDHTRPSLLARGNELVVFDLSAGKVTERFALPIKAWIREIALSPDGRTLAMWTDEVFTGTSAGLSRIDVDGTGYRELYVGRGGDRRDGKLAWTRDGRSILFGKRSNTDDWQIMKISADGGKEQFTGLRVKGLQSISLSPDGSRLAFDGSAPSVSSGNAR